MKYAIVATILLLTACTTTNVERYDDSGNPQTLVNWQGGGDTTRLMFYCPGEGGGIVEDANESRRLQMSGCFFYLESTDASVIAPTTASVFQALIGVIP